MQVIINGMIFNVEKADTPSKRLKGLLGRKELPPGTAMLIAPCNSIHTFFMRLVIDAVFIDRDNRVLKVVKNMGPGRIAGARWSVAVLEMPAGAAEGIYPGDKISFKKGVRAI
jgi:uncharacterized membrane protein (UPF0127 family)